MSPTDRQEGGSHYDLPIQPLEYIHKNSLTYMEGNVVKYVSRHRRKNGAQDILKAIHYLELILEYEYDESNLLQERLRQTSSAPRQHPDSAEQNKGGEE